MASSLEDALILVRLSNEACSNGSANFCVDTVNIIMCMLSKLGLVLVFVPIFLVMSVAGKSRLWLSLIGSVGISMLLFMMVSAISPLNATFINVILSFGGALIFSIGIGSISNVILKKKILVKKYKSL